MPPSPADAPGQPDRARGPGSTTARLLAAEPGRRECLRYRLFMISRMSSAVADGVRPTLTPAAYRASCLACAVPDEPDTIAPAWPMVLPSGAVKPAT